MRRFEAARSLLHSAIANRTCPAAVIEVGSSTRPIWQDAFGRLTYRDDAPPATLDTIFDVASLTKVLATTALVMRQVERGAFALDDKVAVHLPSWRGDDRESVTVADLLSHCSGLPAHRRLYERVSGRSGFELAIAAEPLEYAPRSRSIYSDLGFILVGFILENASPLSAQFDAMKSQMGVAGDLQFHPPVQWQRRTAPTRRDPWRDRLLIGEVDDNNAWALGGAAAHSGLFGTAAAVGEFARHLLQILGGRTGVFGRATLEHFIRKREDVPGSSRALGWDTMLPTSSCGTRMSSRAFGHTGFTGTSLWIDPERDLYVVLLTNRVHPEPQGDAITQVRRAVHDAVVEGLEKE